MKRILFLFISLLSMCAFAQNPPHLKFEQPIIHLGNFKSKAGIIRLSFKFKNVDNKPVTILDVHVQCGCTQAEFPKQPIAVGDSGVVKVDFDPQNLIGDQSRSLTVVSTNGNYKKFNTLTIDGHVIDGPAMEELLYPEEFGPALRADMKSVGVGYLTLGTTRTVSILQLYNRSGHDIHLQTKTSNKHIIVKVPHLLSAEQTVKMSVTVKTRGLSVGALNEKVYLCVDGKEIETPIQIIGFVSK